MGRERRTGSVNEPRCVASPSHFHFYIDTFVDRRGRGVAHRNGVKLKAVPPRRFIQGVFHSFIADLITSVSPVCRAQTPHTHTHSDEIYTWLNLVAHTCRRSLVVGHTCLCIPERMDQR